MTRKSNNLIPLFMFGAAIVTIAGNAEATANIIAAAKRIRCPICGYAMGHPIVKHEYPWNNHLNGWYYIEGLER